MNFRKTFIGIVTLLLPFSSYASFIESTMGTAVVNDATATFHNPAALTLLSNQQIVGLGSYAGLYTRFNGQVQQTATGFLQTGSTSTQTNYFLPSLYYAKPLTNQITGGMAVVSNFFNRDIEDSSILRYVQANNNIESIDFIPAVGVKLNEFFSLGAGVNFSYAKLTSNPIVGFPTLNIPDTQSNNQSSGHGLGGDVGLLFKPTQSTLVGLNYQSPVSYRLSGSSTFESTPQIISHAYNFIYWTPGRSVLSVNQRLTPTIGLIATVQRIQFSIFQNLNINGIATPVGIVNASVPYHFRNTWLVTLGGQYKATPVWILRLAATYNQSPGNSSYQITNGNSFILGASTGYTVNKYIVIDGSYAHAFIQNASIHILTGTNVISGVNQSVRDAVSLKLTLNI